MDTARLGRACPSSLQVQCEFAQLAADDPSLYCLDFLRNGAVAWPEPVRHRFPALGQWQGVAHLQSMFREACGLDSDGQVFLASQSARLVRIAARTMFRQCRKVLTSDFNWPAWQAIVNEEAANSGATVHHVQLTGRVLEDGWDDIEISCLLAEHFVKQRCDCIFLPVVSNIGVRLPIEDLVARIRRYTQLRFVLLDAAQAFCHVPVNGPMSVADVMITGCHKWLGAHLPMGVALTTPPHIGEQMREVFHSSDYVTYCQDPLLQLTEQITNGRVNRFSETVDIVPMLSANAALASGRANLQNIDANLARRQSNLATLFECFRKTRWTMMPLDDSIRTGIMLARPRGRRCITANPDDLLAQFRSHGIGLTAYRNATIRISLPADNVQPSLVACLKSALHAISA